jgi:hypothetical protein
MSAQREDQQMEGVQDTKGKGKATQQDVMDDSEESSDESAAEEAVSLLAQVHSFLGFS